jgi:RIO kinase 2
MAEAETAVGIFRNLEPRDFRVLQAIELGMRKYQYVPFEVISNLSGLLHEETEFRLQRLRRSKLIHREESNYIGYALNRTGYDCLAIQAFVKANVIEAFGKKLGVGKEADVYEALTPRGERVAIKFQRLGRTSFRQTRRLRSYVAERRHISWIYQSRLAAEREFEALKLLYPHDIPVPKPISQNRHAIVMGIIEGAELIHFDEIPDPRKTLEETLGHMRNAYVKAGVIHGDLSEYNIILQPNGKVLIIDWPQFVNKSQPNAEDLLRRDVETVMKFFNRRFGLKTDFSKAYAYVKGKDTNVASIFLGEGDTA